MNPIVPAKSLRRHQTHTGLVAPALALLLAATYCLEAADKLESATTNAGPSVNWNTNPAHWERQIEQRQPSSAVRLGKSDFTVSGPLVDGLRRQRSAAGRSLGKRLLSLPVVRLFVPQPMPSPPGGGPYFLWGERDASWASFSKSPAPLGNTDNPIHREASGSLISVGLK